MQRLLLLYTTTIMMMLYVVSSLSLPMPKEGKCVLLFKENGYDLKYYICKIISSAKKSLYLSTYNLNDDDIVNMISKKKFGYIDAPK